MVTVAQALSDAKSRLNTEVIENSGFDAVCLFEKAFGIKYRTLEYENLKNTQADENQLRILDEFVSRRVLREPLQYILGEWEFYGRSFFVGKGVLIPRQDTETLIDMAVMKFKDRKGLKVADLCSGSGCIGLTLEKELDCQSTMLVELSDEALKYLNRNCQLHNSSAEIVHGDVVDEKTVSRFNELDLIVCNPPYLTDDDMSTLQREVKHEPSTALYGGNDGLEFYRGITRLWKNTLADGGMLAFEIGLNQERDVSQILIQHGFENVRYIKDLCGINRVVFGIRKL